MTDKPDFMMQTYIRCTRAALWHALNDADSYTHWDFLGQTATREGDLVRYGLPDGPEMLHARDLEVTPMSRLETTFEPKWDDVTTPSRVVYRIDEEGDFCVLTVEHFGLNNDPDGGTADGWARSLAGLKTYLETGQPANFGGMYLWEEHDQ
ncbi:SRPBCC domain-containing protein [Fontisubflavum oceani]|uniref:SRPBCC domain-containing protein n=1 Tax=Fontisubflavum oceani TaxID=2978973 RepID=UPI0025B59D10|nr:SRPBCC domain-containing protein [Fontisubflavum oceani]WJY20146.1 SRPBCC domain-containing protein [Fontisubflavum oceani]